MLDFGAKDWIWEPIWLGWLTNSWFWLATVSALFMGITHLTAEPPATAGNPWTELLTSIVYLMTFDLAMMAFVVGLVLALSNRSWECKISVRSFEMVILVTPLFGVWMYA